MSSSNRTGDSTSTGIGQIFAGNVDVRGQHLKERTVRRVAGTASPAPWTTHPNHVLAPGLYEIGGDFFVDVSEGLGRQNAGFVQGGQTDPLRLATIQGAAS